MTKRQKPNPFGIKNFNANNPFNIKGFNSKNSSNIKLPKRIMPAYKPIKIDNIWEKMTNENKKNERRLYQDLNKGLRLGNSAIVKMPREPIIQKKSIPRVSTQSSVFNQRPLESIFSRKTPDSIFNERRARNISLVNTSAYNSQPTLSDIIKEAKRKFDEYREKNRRILEDERQSRIIAQERIMERPRIVIQQVPIRNHLENSISQIHEKLSQKDKEVTDLQNKVKKVTNDMTELKERVIILENYDHELIEQITSLLKIKNEQGENMPIDAMTLLTELLKEKQKTEVDIESIKTKLNEIGEQQKKVVEQQEKDVPFNQSLRKLLDDAKDDSQVL